MKKLFLLLLLLMGVELYGAPNVLESDSSFGFETGDTTTTTTTTDKNPADETDEIDGVPHTDISTGSSNKAPDAGLGGAVIDATVGAGGEIQWQN